MKKNKITLLNVISSLLLQICNIVSTFIIPKIILTFFGSDVNGLIASLTQFLSYISLVEGGITGVLTANLYSPLVNNDTKKISSIINTADYFFKKIGIIFIVYSIALAIIYPIFFKTGFSFSYVFLMTIILAIGLIIQYMFSLSLKTLLTADKKLYIVSFVQIIIIFLNIIVTIVSVFIYKNVHFLKLISSLLFILQPIIYSKYVKKYFKLDKTVKLDNNLLKDRWNGFAINIAAFIHFSTDITILTIFTNLSVVSVYSVYALVTSGLRSIINSISNGINPTIGHAYALKDYDDLNKKLDLHEFIIDLLVFFSFGISILLITPFVLIYTKGITDANYNQNLFGILLLLSEALYILKFPHLNLAYSANKFKDITIHAYIESIINIIVSIVLVYKLGLIGVAIGTTLAMIYRLVFHIWYTSHIINSRKQWVFYKKILIFSFATLFSLFICSYFSKFDLTILNFILHSILYSVLFGVTYLIICTIFFRTELLYFYNYLFKKNNKRG